MEWRVRKKSIGSLPAPRLRLRFSSRQFRLGTWRSIQLVSGCLTSGWRSGASKAHRTWKVCHSVLTSSGFTSAAENHLDPGNIVCLNASLSATSEEFPQTTFPEWLYESVMHLQGFVSHSCIETLSIEVSSIVVDVYILVAIHLL
jgi:hypothetical protein